jgi:hypothetical protein
LLRELWDHSLAAGSCALKKEAAAIMTSVKTGFLQKFQRLGDVSKPPPFDTTLVVKTNELTQEELEIIGTSPVASRVEFRIFVYGRKIIE